MSTVSPRLKEHLIHLSAILPSATLERIVVTLAGLSTSSWAQRESQILAAVIPERYRPDVHMLLSAWRDDSPGISPQSLALALETAAGAIHFERNRQQIDLILTGPELTEMPLRRTEQALLEVIDGAVESLLIVSFVVYRLPSVVHAMLRAYARGVALHICVEAPEPSGYRMAQDTLAALGPDVRQRASIYIWPQGQRPQSASGGTGSLHTKCAVADSETLFVSSANLTGHAMQLNMELGVLIRGGPLPGQVRRYFERLIDQGVLRKVEG
jgi:phosphatidylserine/phosphatidylglycerophosphate/cardiolipin synthase-like enzyme